MPKPGVHTLLLDADGVLQHAPFTALGRIGDFGGDDPEGFLAELFASEWPSLRGHERFEEAIARVLAGRGLDPADAPRVIEAWSVFDVDDAALAVAGDARAAGVACHLATNQMPYRRDVMLARGDGDRFDRLFFSCEVGAAKPDPAYFTGVLESLGHGPAGVVFVDDREDNVEAAASVGIAAYVHDPSTGADGLRALLRRAGVAGA